MNPAQVYVIRHAQSEGNRRVEQGLDRLPKTELGSHLTTLGVEQAQALATELASVPFSAIYCSPLHRALQTARILKSARPLVIQQDPLLQERDRDTEKDDEAISRFLIRLQELAALHCGETIALVTHGFVMRGALDRLGLIPSSELPHESVKNTGFIQLEAHDGTFHLLATHRVG